MRYVMLTLAAAVAAVVIPVATASPAVQVTFADAVTFPGNAPPHGTFTATGLQGCASGTFTDDLKSFNAAFTHILVQRHYTCAGAAGDLTAMMVLTTESSGPGAETVSGRWVVKAAGGVLDGLQGSGTIDGENDGGAGTGTVEALVHLG